MPEEDEMEQHDHRQEDVEVREQPETDDTMHVTLEKGDATTLQGYNPWGDEDAS